MTVVPVLLAAGGGSRFHGADHKLMASLHGRPVYRHALDHLLEACFDVAIVVTGAVPLDLQISGDADLDADDRRLVEVHNERWAQGQATSVQRALVAAAELGASAVVVGLADQPFVPAAAWRAVADAAPSALLVVATYDGVIGPNPVRIDRSLWPLLPDNGDQGARDLLRSHRSSVQEVSCPGSADDIDTMEDLQRWKSS